MIFDFENATTRAEALQNLCEKWQPAPQVEWVSLENAQGRITAQDIFSANILPVHRVSAYDGIAVRSADFADGLPDTQGWTEGVEYVRADTGDDFADAYDSIIAIEEVSFDAEGRLHLSPDLQFTKGEAIRAAGTIVQQGEVLVRAHTRLTPTYLAALAIGGVQQVPVLRPLRIAYLPTGSELIPSGTRPRRGENVEANGILLAALLREWGAEVVRFAITRDDRAQLLQSLTQALQCADLVLINGGSSCGEEDFNAALLKERASYFSHGVKAVPGRPVGTAIIEGKPVVNLPGPVLATWLAADWLVRGLVERYYGIELCARQHRSAVLQSDIQKHPDYEMILRVSLQQDENGTLCAYPLPRGLSVPQTLNRADAQITLPIGCAAVRQGEVVEVELL